MIVQQVQELIAKEFISRKNITPRSQLKMDLWFDDFDIAFLLNCLEKKFAVVLPDTVCGADDDIAVYQVAAIVEDALMKRNQKIQSALIQQKIK